VDYTKEQNIISFCTGYGGIELGLEGAGVNVRTIAACEIEAYAIKNLVDKMEKGALQPFPIWSNLKTFDGAPFRDKVHGLIGGYPCQPFSQAGKRKGTEDERHLWPYIQQHIATIRPVWCFFENVSGHLSMGFDEVCKSLWDMGYRVEAGMFTASEVGATHQRKRLFILAHSEDKGFSRGGEPYTAEWGQEHKEIGAGVLSGTSNASVHGGCELADTDNTRNTAPQCKINENRKASKQRRKNKPQLEPRGLSSELADRDCSGLKQSDQENKEEPPEQPNGGGIQREGMANTLCEGLQGELQPRESDKQERHRQDESVTSCSSVWPSRPGQDQFDWEQPRTLKPSVGRTVDGTPEELDANRNRVDRLRLLGNGVVPQTVSLAWVTLWDKMNKESRK